MADEQESESLFEIVYVSSTVGVWSQGVLEDVLKVSRHRNLAAKVSGMLLYCDGGIIQALEGPANAVLETFDRIEADTRHKDVIVLSNSPIQGRCFKDWSMGFSRFSLSEANRALGAVDMFQLSTLFDHIKNDSLSASILLRKFADRYRA